MPSCIQPYVASESRSQKFLGIEGLRGYLAGAVVLTHLTYLSAFDMPKISGYLRGIGWPAVQMFLIISGFVIMHVAMTRRPAYWPYLIERWFRIFPLFALTCLVGFFTDQLLAIALANPDFADRVFAQVTFDVAASERSHLLAHLLAHLSMLHGLIPNSVLAYSEYTFNMPAWVISLQWQFYLAAPLIVLVLRDKPHLLLPLTLLFAVSWLFFRRYGGTIQPSALALNASWFTMGMISRLVYFRIEARCKLDIAIALAIVMGTIAELRPLLLWLVVLAGIDRDAKSSLLERGYHLLLENRFILYCGTRSYSVYLCHFPAISVMVWLLGAPGMLILTCTSVPLIVIVSECAYRWIELPGIALGKHLGEAWRGGARLGLAELGMARLGEAGRGPARQGKAFNSNRKDRS